MRRLLTGLVVAVTAAVAPMLALAGGNQEVAEQIAQSLRNSNRMSDYKIGVKYQDGTAWLRGRVNNQEQMNAALVLASQTPGVTRVVNELSVVSNEAAQPVAQEQAPVRQDTAATLPSNPLRAESAPATAAPAKLGLVERLEAAITGGFDQKPLREEAPARAERVPASFATVPAEMVSGEEPAAEPKPIAPQRAKPIAKATRAPAQVAMNQQVRGPVAPNGGPMPMYTAASAAGGVAPARYDQPCLPNYSWPSYAAYPNYAGVTYPKQYSPTAWPYIGPFYPYPQVPLGWRKVTLEWSDGWWFLDFKDQPASCWHR